MVAMVARRTVTTIQQGSVYKERWTLSDEQPPGTTARQVWFDSAAGEICEIVGEVDGRVVTFQVPYADVDIVPNGAGFYTYIHLPDEPSEDEHMIRWGTTFRRELVFPNSPSFSPSTVVRQFEDTFQRPAGAVGARWKVLVGQPRIFDNTPLFGPDGDNTVGPNWNFFSRYMMRYYQPFNGDDIELSVSLIDKGTGATVIPVCMNSDGSSYLYVGIREYDGTIELGFGTSPDIGVTVPDNGVLEPQITPVAFSTSSSVLTNYKLTYNDTTKRLSFWNSTKTTEIVHWVDDDEIVPHGRGYRYFGIGGNSTLFDSGVQVAYIKAQGTV